jgi:hypothetical protein
MRFVLSTILTGLMLAQVACSNSEPDQAKVRMSESADGSVVIEQLTPGPVRLCRTRPFMEVAVSATRIRVTGGRVCAAHESATLTFDPRSCRVSVGAGAAGIAFSCTGMPGMVPH